MLSLVAFDMDGTLVDVESSWAAVHQAFDDENIEGLRAFMEDRIDDEEFVRSDVRLWQRHRPDLTLAEIATILSSVPLMPGAVGLLRALHDRGVATAIVSGGLDLLAERIGRELGIDHVYANGLRADPKGRLTGGGIIRVPIWGKEAVLEALQERLGIGPEATASIGNSEIDAGLFRRSRIGIAFCPEDDAIRAVATTVVEERDLGRCLAPLLVDGPPAPAGRSPPAKRS